MKQIGEYLNYSSINFGRSLLILTVSTYIMYYYTDILLLPVEIVSILLLICRFVDGAVDPVIGYCMDRRHNRFGKYRGHIILWALPVCILHVAMFSPPQMTGTALIIYCFVIYLLWSVSQSVIECAHSPMLITISDDPGQRRMANTVRISMGILAAMAASYLPLVLAEKLGGGSERRGFALAMLLFALIAFGTILPGALRLKEHNISSDNTLSIRQTFRVLLHSKRLLLLLVMYLCSQIGNSAKSQATVYYMKYNLDRTDLTAIVMLLGVFSSFLMQPLIVLSAKRVRAITLILAGYIGSCLGLVVIGLSGQSILLFFIGNILFGIASAFPGNLVHAYMADLAEGLSKQNSFGGLVVSLLGLTARFGQSLSGALVSGILFFTDYTPNATQSPAALTGIWICLSGLTFVSYFIAVIAAGKSTVISENQAVKQG